MSLATHEYIVQPGDSISSISLRECKSSIWSTVAMLNHLQSPYRIYPGQKLQLPGSTQGLASAGSRPRAREAETKAPAMEFTLKHKVIRIPLIVGTLTLEIEGTVEITSLKNDPEITVNPAGKIEWARNYATCIKGLFGTLGFTLDTAHRKVEVKFGIQSRYGEFDVVFSEEGRAFAFQMPRAFFNPP